MRESRRSASSPSGGPWLPILAAALLGAAVAAVAIVRMGATSTLPDGEPPAPATPPLRPAAEAPAAPPEPTTPPTAPAVKPQASATPKPQRTSVRPTPEAPPAGQPVLQPAPAQATLAVDFQHPLKDGTLRIFLGDTLLLEERLESRAKKVVGLTALRKGSLRRTLSVPPGEHDLRVEVAWDDEKKTGTLWGTFAAGQTRTLEIRMPPVLKRLSVEWK